MLQYPKKRILIPLIFSCIAFSFTVSPNAQGIHVFADAEIAVFNELILNSDPAVTWTTDRSSTPGYFSAVGDAVFSGAANGTPYLVDGYVKYYRDNSSTTTSFTFPLGQATAYRPLTLSGTLPTNAGFAAAWFAGDPDVTTDPTDASVHLRNSRGAGVVGILGAGFWDWQTLSGTANGMRITVNIPDVSAQVATQNLILVGWNGTAWVNLSGAEGAGPYAGNWADGNAEGAALTGSWQAGITALAIGSVSYILPLKLESFIGRMTECKAALSWKTADEINTSHFVVQSSVDGIEWKAITTIAAQGNGNGKTYSFSVAQSAQKQLYRLQMADKDGKISYSQSLSLYSDCGRDKTISVSPNPVTAGTLQLALQTSYKGKASLVLRNASGQVLLNKAVVIQAGINVLNLNASGLAAGTYFVFIADANGNNLFTAQKIIKQ